MRPGAIVRGVAKYLSVALLGCLAGGTGLFVFWLNSGAQVEIWHEVELDEEFSADRAGEIGTFEAYRALEERLFAEVDAEVYEQTGTGPELTLVRYSRGSASDPARWPTDWNRSFELPADSPAGGVLLLHGMSDSPYSLRALGEALGARGHWVLGLRMPGHGTVPAGLRDATWQDMAAAVRIGMSHLAERAGGAPVHVIGYSTGAPLAIGYALEALAGEASPLPASLTLISPAIGLSRAAVLTPWLVRAARLPGLDKLAWTSIQPEFDPFRYNSFTSNAGRQVHLLTRRLAGALAREAGSGPVTGFPPTLVLLSSADATVSVDAVVDNLLRHLGPGEHELVLYDINRSSIKSGLLVSDPAPLTQRLVDSDELPFHFSLITNAGPNSDAVVSRRKPALSREPWTRPLGMRWPEGTISLSHVALPFPPDDPLYGRAPEGAERVHDAGRIFLGGVDIRGECGLLRLSADWLLRLRHNPFYDHLESRVLEWVDSVGGDGAGSAGG